ncbi:hypothetical protein WOLCODRAFT_27460 [Wolfiporia cocos MD-104 SS10]|uniref:Uncharacterized protein n=1 Tax=Wolfiporia cocos (strain MD-104) TaxID=742152 RepID=A0A2H3IYH3_WOLCO|nr:hypothetical protein WOLCODRAFT_27460 [Wolfiporia cocos MD-104 SS10]
MHSVSSRLPPTFYRIALTSAVLVKEFCEPDPENVSIDSTRRFLRIYISHAGY